MDEKIQVLDLKLNNMSAKEAMKQAVTYIQTEPLHVIEMITMQALRKFREEENVDEIFESFDLVLASDKEILQVAGIIDERRLKEMDELIFIKMVLRYLQKNNIRVFLLAEASEDMEKLEGYMREDYTNIQVVESATLEENGASDDMLLNLINGSESVCVLSVLPSPLEEKFICRNKALVNAKLWLGLGNMLDELKRERSRWEKVKRFVLRLLLKKEMTKKGENA
jgi:N-acetylglucosaminyldiphosphoundecaprenol N-acetyl-beta-D-mannosaminyltransferase